MRAASYKLPVVSNNEETAVARRAFILGGAAAGGRGSALGVLSRTGHRPKRSQLVKSKLGGKLPIVLSVTALVVAVLGWSTPAIAHGVQHALFAHNSDKVDGKSAVASTASLDQAGGKLVATLGTGPNKGRIARKFVNSAYAKVNAGGSFVADWTRNFSAVTNPSTGLYCLQPAAGIDPTKSPLLVSAEWSTSLGNDLFVYWRSSGIGCPTGWYAVLTYQLAGDATADLSSSVSFAAYVP
jgi:hypothetical protein